MSISCIPPTRRVRILTSCACLMPASIPPANGELPSKTNEWPGFRGPNADGVSTETAVFAGLDGFGLEVAWKHELGSGYSGVAIADAVVVTMFSDGTSDVAIALDEKNGEERWRFEVGPTYTGHDGSHTGPIPTPLIADGRVFGLGPRGRLFALDVESGQVVWESDLVKDQEAKKPHYGFGTSPVILDGVLVVQLGGKDGAIAGFNAETGKRLWTVGSDPIQYQSPILLTLHGRRQVLAATDKHLFGIDPQAGDILWKYAHGGGGARGVASLVPVPAGDQRLFLAFKDDASTLIELTQQADSVEVQTTWEERSIRNSYNVPVYHDGHLYAYSTRFLTCVDAATGKSVWRSRKPGDGFLILVDRHLVIVTKEGGVYVAKASPDGYQELASLSLFEDLAWSPPSFANGRIYGRSLSEIARVDIRPGVAVARAKEARDIDVSDSRFSRFLGELRAASDKKGVVDRFMAANKRFPVTDGDGWVHFLYRGPGEDLAVAGDMFGARQERSMTRVEGTDLFYHSTRLEVDARVNYVFLEDYEQILDPLNPRETTTVVLGKDMEMAFMGQEMEMSWCAMPKWRPPAHLDEPTAASRGRIETKELDSKHVEQKHAVDVYLPAGYDNSQERYPVAYVHGGTAAKDRGQYVTALDNLIGKRVRPIIAVFINYTPRGGGQTYRAMFEEELIPYIDENYRTIPSADARANVGAGFSGFAALGCTFGKPGLVGKVATQSLFMFDSMKAGLEPNIQTPKEQPLQIYLDWGKYDLQNPHEAWDLRDTNRKFAQFVRDKGYKLSGGEVHDGTGWSSWQHRTDDVFQTLFPLHPTGGSD